MALDWCPFAVKRPIVSDNFTVGRSGQKVKALVLHIAAGPLTAVFPTFNNPARQASAHFCIGKDGTLEQYVSVNDTAYANGLSWVNNQWQNARGKIVQPTWQDIVARTNPNLYTVSIEHEGHADEVWTNEMYDANNRLLAWLAEQFALALIPHRTLIGHYEIDPVDKPNCPGPHVEYVKMSAEVSAIQAAQKIPWMPINDQAALYKFAQTKNLGYPQTDEFTVTVNGADYIAQVFNLGIVYVKVGDWGNVKWTKKI